MFKNHKQFLNNNNFILKLISYLYRLVKIQKKVLFLCQEGLKKNNYFIFIGKNSGGDKNSSIQVS